MKKTSELGLEVIQLEDQVLLINSKSGTSKEDLFIDKRTPDEIRKHVADSYENHFDDHWRYKIIASTKPLEGLPLLVIEDEVEKLGEDQTNIRIIQHRTPIQVARQYFDGFIDGHNKAKETFRFTEEDLANAMKALSMEICTIDEDLNLQSPLQIAKWCANYIQSLTKKELWIETDCEYGDDCPSKGAYDKQYLCKIVPKITNNQIKAVWK